MIVLARARDSRDNNYNNGNDDDDEPGMAWCKRVGVNGNQRARSEIAMEITSLNVNQPNLVRWISTFPPFFPRFFRMCVLLTSFHFIFLRGRDNNRIRLIKLLIDNNIRQYVEGLALVTGPR